MAVEEEFAVEIPDNDAQKIATTCHLMDFIAAHPHAKWDSFRGQMKSCCQLCSFSYQNPVIILPWVITIEFAMPQKIEALCVFWNDKDVY